MDRRKFLKSLGTGMLGATGTVLAAGRPRAAEMIDDSGKEFKGVLVDTTR